MATLNLQQAARFLGIQPRTLRGWICQTKRGERRTPVPYVQYDNNSPYQFDADALSAFRDAHTACGVSSPEDVRRRLNFVIDRVRGTEAR